MLFILEIILTVVAWRRGWRARALLPLGGALAVAFLVGIGVGSSGGSVEEATPLLVLLDIACVAVLIVLASRPPRDARDPQVSEASAPAEATLDRSELQEPAQAA